jgi:DoxX-like family
MKPPPIYVETFIHAPMDALWAHTQQPELHQQWDLRFTEIRYLPRPSDTEPQQFLYTTRIGFGLGIAGRGESMGTKEKNGERTSVLKFWSDEGLSLIRVGSGFWKYVPVPAAGGLRFFTRYDYQTRWGPLGRWLDRWAFRPLIGWGTAWSFDCLRIWLERGTRPATAIRLTLTRALVRGGLGAAWLYQGIVPKLLFPDTGELRILHGAGFSWEAARHIATAVGIGEIAFGLLGLLLPARWMRPWLWLNLLGLVGLGSGAIFSQPEIFVAPFNPITLNLTMAVLAVIGLAHYGPSVEPDVPRAGRCLRQAPPH